MAIGTFVVSLFFVKKHYDSVGTQRAGNGILVAQSVHRSLIFPVSNVFASIQGWEGQYGTEQGSATGCKSFNKMSDSAAIHFACRSSHAAASTHTTSQARNFYCLALGNIIATIT